VLAATGRGSRALDARLLAFQERQDISLGGQRRRTPTRSNLRGTAVLPEGPRPGETVQIRIEGYDGSLLTSGRQPSGWRPATRPYDAPLNVVVDPADPLIGIARQDLGRIADRDVLRDVSSMGLLGCGLLVAGAGAQGVRVLRRRRRARSVLP